MAPPRRPTFARPRTRSQYTPPPVTSVPTKQDPMPPTSRYLHNLKVIQRHDPSITSLFDQFPHVCVYHHKGDEWRKKGCEGAMFLFEREEEPKYGFYILNRNNTGDYIQRMTPEDDVEFASAYLIYRAFGKVTSDTIGLWTMVTQDREAMSQVMMRLHSYIKRGVRYPDEYRRRPDTWSTTPAPAHAEAVILPLPAKANLQPTSTLSTLLEKLGNPAISPPDPPNRAVSASVPPPTGIPLLDTIFASASNVALSNDHPSQIPSLGGNSPYSVFANGVTTSQSSSMSTPCGPTPTQHMSELPMASSPSRSDLSMNSTARGYGVLPNSGIANINGLESTPTGLNVRPTLESFKASRPNFHGFLNVDRRRCSTQYLAVPDTTQEVEEEGWAEEAIANLSLGESEEVTNSRPPSRRNRARNSKRREREREQRRSSNRENGYQEGMENHAAIKEVHAVEWPLVDDRSLSIDEDDIVGSEAVGLGDGLLSALAAVSDVEAHNTTQRSVAVPPKRKTKDRGKDRRKRKLKEHGKTPSQTSEMAGDASSSTSSHPVEVRSALLEAYGQRRRVGDSVLSEQALAAEVIELINNDSTFVRELHQQYLRKVQL